MYLSSLSDPVDLARAQAALDAAWLRIQALNLPDLGSAETERCRLSYIVSGLLRAAASDADLVDRAVARFISIADGRRPVERGLAGLAASAGHRHSAGLPCAGLAPGKAMEATRAEG